ncbi:MAG: glycosyltransferase [Thermoplasmata archaeon]
MSWTQFFGWVHPIVSWARTVGLPLGAVAVGLAVGALLYTTLTSLQRSPSTEGAGTVRMRLIRDRTTLEASETRGVAIPIVRLFTRGAVQDAPMEGAGEHPSLPLPRAIDFVAALVVAFVIFSIPTLLFYHRLFGYYDHLVGFVGTFLYWPLTWPGVYAVSVQTLVVPDFIFPMYLAAMTAYLVASGLATNQPRYTSRRRWLAIATILVYIGLEFVLDALFFTVPGETLRNLALLVRALTGGLFMALLVFCSVYLPKPQVIVPRFRRDRAAIAVFFGLGAVTLAVSAAILLYTAELLHLEGIYVAFTLLLLLPVLGLTMFGVLARPLYFRQIRKAHLPPLSSYHPSVSILIPAYNEEEWIRDVIGSADRASAHYPGRVELIVGNDGSTDRTLELARDAIAHLQHSKGVVVDLPHGGKSNALNGALAVATGDIVIRCDGDTSISETPGFSALIPHFADPEVGGVQGAIHPRQKNGWTRKLRALEVAWMHYLLRPANMGTRSAEVIDGLFSSFRRSDLVEIGGWVPWNGEDTEISMRIQRLGYRVRIEFGALAHEDVPANYSTLRKQRVRWARGVMMANGQHYQALLGPTPEFAGLAVLFWFLLVMRSGVRSLVYVFLAFLIIILGVPALLFTIVLLLIGVVIRAIPLAYFLIRMGRPDVLLWLPFFPVGNIIKQTFRFEGFGTLGPGASAEYI